MDFVTERGTCGKKINEAFYYNMIMNTLKNRLKFSLEVHLKDYRVNKEMAKDFFHNCVHITYKQNLVNEQDTYFIFPECFCSIPLSLNIKECCSLRLSLNIISLPETSTILKVM